MGFNWIVSQIGARQHYGVPRGFFYKNELRSLYTEAWCRWGRNLLHRGPPALRAFAGRYHPDIPNSKVISFSFNALRNHWKERDIQTLEEQYHEYLRIGHWF